MKKILIVAIFILATIGFEATAYATSGARFYHNGVNCSAGADLGESFICHDGWGVLISETQNISTKQIQEEQKMPLRTEEVQQNEFAPRTEQQSLVKQGLPPTNVDLISPSQATIPEKTEDVYQELTAQEMAKDEAEVLADDIVELINTFRQDY